MARHGYEAGRLNLPFVGICTFGKYPLVEEWNEIDADGAGMGAPFDAGTQWRAGARMGPRVVREASTLFSFGHAGAYDHEDDVTYLDPAKVTVVDIGDAVSCIPIPSAAMRTSNMACAGSWRPGRCRWCSAGTIRSTFPASLPSRGKSRSTWSRSTPIWISSMNATTGSGVATATRCAAPPRNPMSPV